LRCWQEVFFADRHTEAGLHTMLLPCVLLFAPSEHVDKLSAGKIQEAASDHYRVSKDSP